jgi:hypothetical protein
MISEVWKTPLLMISDHWPSELAPNPLSMRLTVPFDLDDLYAKVGSALLEEPARNIS